MDPPLGGARSSRSQRVRIDRSVTPGSRRALSAGDSVGRLALRGHRRRNVRSVLPVFCAGLPCISASINASRCAPVDTPGHERDGPAPARRPPTRADRGATHQRTGSPVRGALPSISASRRLSISASRRLSSWQRPSSGRPSHSTALRPSTRHCVARTCRRTRAAAPYARPPPVRRGDGRLVRLPAEPSAARSPQRPPEAGCVEPARALTGMQKFGSGLTSRASGNAGAVATTGLVVALPIPGGASRGRRRAPWRLFLQRGSSGSAGRPAPVSRRTGCSTPACPSVPA